MKIGIDIRSLLEKEYTGVSEYTLALLKNLFTYGVDNEYVLFYNSFKNIVIPEFKFKNVRIVRTKIPNKIFNLSLRFLNWPKIDKLVGGVDIFFMPNWQFYALTKKTKLVVTVHDLTFMLYPRFFSLKQLFWHKLINPKRFCQSCNKIIAVSNNTKNDLITQFGIASQKIEVIYSGIDQIYKSTLDESVLRTVRLKFNLPQKYVLYLGCVEERKNINNLIKSFRQLNIDGCHLVIAGKFGKMKKFYDTNNKANKILFLGYVSNLEKQALYQMAKVFIYPSIYEGFGFPPLEATTCNLPVITSHTSSLVEVARNDMFMIDPNNINEITLVLKEIIMDQRLLDKFKGNNIKNIDFFNWQNCAIKVNNLFSSL